MKPVLNDLCVKFVSDKKFSKARIHSYQKLIQSFKTKIFYLISSVLKGIYIFLSFLSCFYSRIKFYAFSLNY
jgi:hypothetical protein